MGQTFKKRHKKITKEKNQTQILEYMKTVTMNEHQTITTMKTRSKHHRKTRTLHTVRTAHATIR